MDVSIENFVSPTSLLFVVKQLMKNPDFELYHPVIEHKMKEFYGLIPQKDYTELRTLLP